MSTLKEELENAKTRLQNLEEQLAYERWENRNANQRSFENGLSSGEGLQIGEFLTRALAACGKVLLSADARIHDLTMENYRTEQFNGKHNNLHTNIAPIAETKQDTQKEITPKQKQKRTATKKRRTSK